MVQQLEPWYKETKLASLRDIRGPQLIHKGDEPGVEALPPAQSHKSTLQSKTRPVTYYSAAIGVKRLYYNNFAVHSAAWVGSIPTPWRRLRRDEFVS
jgi:hypothetical protein